MCGICGMMGLTGAPIDEDILFRMARVMRHRGPDDEGYHINGNLGLGFRRLSILDLDHGHQPLSNEDHSVWVIFNGEIYNYTELRDQLVQQGHTFRTNTDTEVIVHLYEEEGISCVNRLRGMFAFAIWDARRQELYLARDHFGIKPLYYIEQGDTLLFASEVKSLVSSGMADTTLNLQSVWDYFTYQYVPDPKTMFANILKLPPAHYLRVKDGTMTLKKYWEPMFEPDDSKPLSFYVEGLEHLLSTSVRLHLNADVPQGAFLSSGVDSASIVAFMRQSKESLQTFSVGFQGSRTEMNELQFAREVANFYQTKHTDLMITPQMSQDRLPHIVAMLDEPIADPSVVGLYFVSQLASSQVKVILSGEGADEIFAGYPIYHEPRSLELFSMMPLWAREGLRKLAGLLPQEMRGRGFLQRGSAPVERRFIGNANIFSEDAKQMLLQLAAEKMQTSFAITDPIYKRTAHLDDITRMQLVDLNTWLPGDILMKADKMTMANSLELRVPFLDREVFDFASKIPHQYRVHGRQTKYVLRQAMSRMLPKEIRDRPKLGFPVPYREWIRTDLREFVWDIIQSLPVDSVINRPFVTRLMEEHCAGHHDYGREIWAVMIFILWQQSYIAAPCLQESNLTVG